MYYTLENALKKWEQSDSYSGLINEYKKYCSIPMGTAMRYHGELDGITAFYRMEEIIVEIGENYALPETPIEEYEGLLIMFDADKDGVYHLRIYDEDTGKAYKCFSGKLSGEKISNVLHAISAYGGEADAKVFMGFHDGVSCSDFSDLDINEFAIIDILKF